MKVVHILNELKFSGAEIMYASAAKEFQKLGCELYVVSTAQDLGEYAVHFRNAGYQVLHWPYMSKSLMHDLKFAKKSSTFFRDNKIDVVHIHRSTMRLMMSYAAWKAGCKALYTFHNVFPTKWYTKPYHIAQRWIAKNIFKCVFQTISDSVYEHEKNFYYNNTYKVYNWYDNSRFFPASDSEKRELRKQLIIPENALVLISIGGCSHIKRHSDIINALPLIIEKYPNVIYLHLGEGDTLETERMEVEKLGLKEHVRFEGNQKDVRKFLVVSDIYLMTSEFEGISLTTIEAMVTKIPAILYDVPGLRDFNASQRCAKLIPQDYEKLAKAVIALNENRLEQDLLIENGKALVDAEFNMPKNVKKIVELYQL
ncbi:glycosyltransferase [uncultured Zobellia sp.]|uniref:glycosyltransferase n=1 Tax=uncultured Zobellia sp. TaxID=255433 RepID=UPI002599896B|nr:glycosyltransferase [uncultured Zobellia sp.]